MAAPKKLLIVDDDKTMHNLIKSALVDNGRFQFLHAYNGAEGVQVYKEHKPSLMLLDIDMPVMNGIQVLRNLDFTNNKECPVIVISGLASHKVQDQCLELGAQMFMGKPFQIMALIKSINYFLIPGSRQ